MVCGVFLMLFIFLCAGLKATESELEKFKCVKCDYQAYYQQQYQEHIATHKEDIHRCKCCSYLTFDEDDLLNHFKVHVCQYRVMFIVLKGP